MPVTRSKPGCARMELVDPTVYPDWDRCLAQLPGASVFHSSSWARVLRDSYGFEPCYIVGRRENELATVIPIMEVASKFTGRRGVSLPFTDRCSILASPADHHRLMDDFARWEDRVDTNDAAMSPEWQHVQREAARRKWQSFECRDGADFSGPSPSQIYLDHTLDLTDGISTVEARLSSSTRRAIRKCQGAGVEIKIETTLAAMKDYYRLHCLTRRHHGLPPQPFQFFENIHRHLINSGAGFVALARNGNVLIAGAVFLYFGRQAVYKFGASDPVHLPLRGNNLVMWRSIQQLAAEGFESLNLGRTFPANEGLRRFKSGWGAEERRIQYWRFDFGAAVFSSRASRETGWHTPFFRLMPVTAARWIGRFLYRHMA